MNVDPHDLKGRFVVEVGLRQAWPFLTLCDPRPAYAHEVRLFIDTTFQITSDRTEYHRDDPNALLFDLNGLTVTSVEVGSDQGLVLGFDDGGQTLSIDGTSADFTTADVWWLSQQ